MRLNRLYRIKFYIFLGLLALIFSQPVYAKITYPGLRDFEPPKVERVTLDNGIRLFLAEDHELGIIELDVMVRTGSVYEPAEKIGLASMTGMVMRTGGTANKTGDQIDEELERIAASIETGIGINSGSASMWVLKENFDTALAVLADILMNPAFRQDKVELAKISLDSDIARRNDNVFSLAIREYLKLIYGPQSVYARQTEYATINNITRSDLAAFHKKFYHPNNIMIAVCGDFNTKEMIAKLRKAFEGWKKTDVQIPEIPKVQYQYKKTVNLIEKDDINQSAICMGHIGGQMNDPDYFALALMNRVLGAGFTSRLFKNVRSRLGLAYDVYGVYKADYDHPGFFYVGCQTKSSATVQAIGAMTEQVKSMTQAEITDEELALAKESFLNSFVFNFETKSQVVRRLMTYEYFGYPPDFLQKTKENIIKVTKKDILEAAKKNLRPDNMQILVVGRPQDFGTPLTQLGPVSEIDVNIPPAK